MKNFFKSLPNHYQKCLQIMRRSRYYRKQSLTALIFNTMLAEIFLFAAGYMWFVYRTKIPLLALILTMVVMIFFTLAIFINQRKSYNKKKADARRKAGRNYLAAQLKQLNSEEFMWQITRLLLQLDGITDIKSCEDYLETTLHGKRTAIGLYNAKYDKEVAPQHLADFLNRVKLEGYQQAVFVTSGTYPDSCKAIAEKKSATKIQLLDLEDLLDLMEQAGMFPDDKTIDNLIDKEISKSNKLLALKKELLTPKRIKTYLGYSLFFFVLSRLFKSLSIYYVLVSVIFFLLALFVWLRSLKVTPESEESSLLLNLQKAEKSQGS
ncbi:MAG TPA: restriction endonuclease [Clostridiales bacterium]|nr:restriction endonuclease [Clostridiales bacterium]